MTNKVEITCKCGCGRKKLVRTADVKRGWGKFFSKSCKAIHQEKRTGQYKSYLCRKTQGKKKRKPVREYNPIEYVIKTEHRFASNNLHEFDNVFDDEMGY